MFFFPICVFLFYFLFSTLHWWDNPMYELRNYIYFVPNVVGLSTRDVMSDRRPHTRGLIHSMDTPDHTEARYVFWCVLWGFQPLKPGVHHKHQQPFDKINPKDCQVKKPLVIQSFSNFLGLFQVIMANPETHRSWGSNSKIGGFFFILCFAMTGKSQIETLRKHKFHSRKNNFCPRFCWSLSPSPLLFF